MDLGYGIAEKMGGEDGLNLLMAILKVNLPFTFINGAQCYGPFVLQLIHVYHEASPFHQNMIKDVMAMPYNSGDINVAGDTAHEMDNKGLSHAMRARQSENAVINRMTSYDRLQVSKNKLFGPRLKKHTVENQISIPVSTNDLTHIYRSTGMILRNDIISMSKESLPYNKYCKTSSEPVLLPLQILDECTLDVGFYLMRRCAIDLGLYGLSEKDLTDVALMAWRGMISGP